MKEVSDHFNDQPLSIALIFLTASYIIGTFSVVIYYFVINQDTSYAD